MSESEIQRLGSERDYLVELNEQYVETDLALKAALAEAVELLHRVLAGSHCYQGEPNHCPVCGGYDDHRHGITKEKLDCRLDAFLKKHAPKEGA